MAQDDAKEKGRVVLTEEELLAIVGGNDDEGAWELDPNDPNFYTKQLDMLCQAKSKEECSKPLCEWRGGTQGCVGFQNWRGL